MSNRIACLFPAFTMRYRDFGRASLEGYEEEVASLLARARAVVDVDLRKFEWPGQFALDDEIEDDLQEHYVSYVDCCAVGRVLKKMGVACEYAAGYSMGLFAAMHHGSAISFEDGLQLLRRTCTFAHEAVARGDYGMGAVVGLTPEEVGELAAKYRLSVEVADVCGPRVVVISGRRRELETLLGACEAQGSLQSRLLPVTVPFHSTFLREVEGRIRDALERIEICEPQCALISCVDQRVLTSREEVRQEAAGNACRPIRWYNTMRRLLALGVDVFLECGPSDSLCNLARNVEGRFRAYHPRKLDRFFASEIAVRHVP